MQVDSFICSTPTLTPHRHYFQQITLACLQRQDGVIPPQMLYKPFILRYYEANRLAKTNIFVLCDNDIVLPTHDTLQKAIRIMEKYPNYSQLGLGWLPDMERERQSSWKTGENNEIWDFDHCGGCVLIRKDSIKDMGYKAEFDNGYGDDRVMGKIAREMGFKVGVIPSLYFIHLGDGYGEMQV